MTRLAYVLALLLATMTPVAAQDEGAPRPIPMGAVLDLAELPFLAEAPFIDALAGALPTRIRQSGPVDTPHPDPFLWAIGGTFGPETGRRNAGAIFACARYGLATRDAFLELGYTAATMFQLFSEALPLSDDEAVWPDGAVARLHCTFVWDDARVVPIVPEAEAQAALEQVFDSVSSTANTQFSRSLYGPDGFELTGTGGRDDSVTFVESGRITLTLGHQSLQFRSFLMGGGT